VNLFNNQWTTNFRMWNEGSWSVRVRLWAFDRFDVRKQLIVPSLEARIPLQAAFADGTAGKLPRQQEGLRVSRPGVQVSALGANPDGEGTLLRLWELAGLSGNLSVTLPPGWAARVAQPVDLRGRRQGEPIGISEGAFSFPLRAYAPASFELR